MKHKFSSMGRVAIALVLALSLVLVMGVPVSADVSESSVTLDDYTAGATGVVYTIEFDVGVALAIGNNITVTFPSDTTVPTDIAVGQITVEDTNDLDGAHNPSGVEVTGRAVTMTTHTDTGLIEAGHTVEVVFLTTARIDNPSVGGPYQLDVNTTFEDIDVPSAAYTITIVPDSFEVVAGDADTVTAGEAFSVVITALKADETPETTYTGDRFIAFEWADGPGEGAPIIPSFELITFADGVGTPSSANFMLTKVETGIKIKATATLPGVTGTSDAITVNPAALATLAITGGDADRIAGVPFANDVTVTAYDAYDNKKTDYTGTVSWTSTDTTATAGAGLPADYTFTGAGTGNDNGDHDFAAADFVLKTVLLTPTKITVTDAVAGKSGPMSITVTAAAATALEVESDVAVIKANASDTATITVSAVDDYGNVDTGYSGTTADASTNLGAIAPNFDGWSDGEDEATLTSISGEVGTATVKVTADLPYATATVSIVATTAVTEVWVDDDYDAATNDGGHDFGTDAFATIQEGINAVATGGTVNVGPGVYTPGSSLGISKGLTLKSTDGAAETIIETTDFAPDVAVDITANDVTVEGFTITYPAGGTLSVLSIRVANATSATIRDNVIENLVDSGLSQIALSGVSDSEVSDNTLIASYIQLDDVSTSTISGNDVRDAIGAGCITIRHATDLLIQGNSLSGGAAGISMPFQSAGTAEGIQILGNDITDNTDANGEGIAIGSLVIWGAGNAITNNNITGNTEGIGNWMSDVVVDATNNWWGTDVESEIADLFVVGYVDYTPWLPEEYAEPTDPVTTYSITLAEGWNLISLPLIPDIAAIETVLTDLIAEVTVDEVRTYWRTSELAGWYDWASTGPAGDLDLMEDGPGYWILMNSADTLVITGSELEAAPATPKSYSVYEGWNLIGFKSLRIDEVATDYLDELKDVMRAMYSYDAATEVYEVVILESDLVPGKGYWLAVSAAGTIYP